MESQIMDDAEELELLEETLKQAQTKSELEIDFNFDEYCASGNEDESDENSMSETESVTLPLVPFESNELPLNERKIVDSCKDANIQELMRLNRRKNRHLLQLYHTIQIMLDDCKESIQQEERKRFANTPKRVNMRHWNAGMPYFKNKKSYPAPLTPQAKAKSDNAEVIYYNMTPSRCFNKSSARILLEGVKFISRQTAKTEILKTDPDFDGEINTNLDTIDVESFNWNHLAEKFFPMQFTAIDCKVFWQSYLHPRLNKDEWTEIEKRNLKVLAKKFKNKNWNRIAEELNTNRSGYMCYVTFTKIANRIKCRQRFTEEEDEKLMDLVEKWKDGNKIPWGQIQRYFPNRTRKQVFGRYSTYLKKRSVVAYTRFTKAEDVLCLILNKRMEGNFSQMSHFFPNRNASQLKSRIRSYLMNATKKGSFTQKEDWEIIAHVKQFGTANWRYLAEKMDRVPGHIRTRYRTLKKFNFDMSIMPRKHFATGMDNYYDFVLISKVADVFDAPEPIPTLDEIATVLKGRLYEKGDFKVTVDVSVDRLIVEHLSTCVDQSHPTTVDIKSISKSIQTVLSALQVKLKVLPNFHNLPLIDNDDVKILRKICKPSKCALVFTPKGKKLKMIPPTISTTIGMSGMLIKYNMYKEKLKSQPNYSQLPTRISWWLSEKRKKPRKCENVQMFLQRVGAIFFFPAMLSLVEPPKIAPSPLQIEPTTKVLRTYKRKIKGDEEPDLALKRRINQAFQEAIQDATTTSTQHH